MIVQIRLVIDGTPYIRTYSDCGRLIQDQTGMQYGEALDREDAGRSYTEVEPDLPVTPQEIYDILVRGVTDETI